VDEVLPNAPWTVDESFIYEQKFDYLALDEGMSVDPACDKFRLKGYDTLKRLGRHDSLCILWIFDSNVLLIGKVIPTRRTSGVTIPVTVPDGSPFLNAPVLDEDFVDRQIERYGIGSPC